MMAYLVMMAVRLHDLHKKLKPTGAMYLHCDPTASHYLKVILDGVFGPKSFRSEIIWKRSSAHNSAKRWGPVHDTILFYTVSETYTWNRIFSNYDEEYIDQKYRHKDKQGRRYRLSDLTGPGTTNGDSGAAWRGVNPSEYGRHWAPPLDRALPSWFTLPAGWESLPARKRLDIMEAEGLIQWPKKDGGRPEFRRYLETASGNPIQDVITDIDPINSMAQERIGYPTQKPLPLLERIISASTNEGDTILDPFCGCGTTIEAAEKLGRKWIGIDIAIHAIKVIEARIRGSKYKVEGIPMDFESAVILAENDKYQFQWWANYLFNPHALREQKRGADQGVDGEIFFANGPGRTWGRMLTSVKGGANVGVKDVREFARVLDREKAEMGLFITLYKPTRPMIVEASTLRSADTVHGNIPRLQIVAIEEFFAGKFPSLPPLEHLPSAAFSTTRRRATAMKAAPPNSQQPQLPLVFAGGKLDSVVHLNRSMVSSATADDTPVRKRQAAFALR